MVSWLDKARSKFSRSQSGPFVALDLDSRRLRVVYAEPRSPLPLFRKLAAIDVPAELDFADPAAVGQFIGRALRDQRLAGQRVAMDVPRSKALLKTVTLPPVEDERELPGMVRFQVEKELPYAMSEAVIDFTVESGSAPAATRREDGGQTVLVAAVRRSVVEYYQKVAEAAQIDLEQLGLRPYADVHCLRACLGEAAIDAVLVHLTADEAEINVLLDGSLAFSRSASMVIAHDEQGKPLAESPVDGMVLEVVRTVQSIRASQRGAEIRRLWVAGETGHESEFALALGKRLGAPCEVLEPSDLLKQARLSGPASGYVTALGLAIGHTERGLPLDFLHPKEPPVERDLAKVRRTQAAIAAAAVVVLVLVIGLWNRHAASSQLAALVERYNQLDEELKPVRKMADRVKSIDGWLGGDRAWLDHWANITAAFPPAPDAYITSLKTTPQGIISFTIKARSSAVITEAGKKLREAGYDLQLGSETTDENENGYRFINEFRLTPKSEPKVAGLIAPPRPADDVNGRRP